MTEPRAIRMKQVLECVALAGLVGVAPMILLRGQAPAQIQSVGVPDDWSHHHLVFSSPGTYQQAALNGTAANWLKITSDPRFLMQKLGRAAAGSTAASDEAAVVRKRKIHRDWSMNLGSSGKVGAGNYPAKYQFSTTTASCSDWVAYNTGLAGSGTSQATVIAYNNLYNTTCTGSVPQVLWAYNTTNTGTGSTVKTSIIISATGTQVAFIQTTSSGASYLVILKPSTTPSNTVTTPTDDSSSISSYHSCTSGCMYTMQFTNASGTAITANDTNSSPFYDYANDVLYVGDDSGYLHAFTHVFNGAGSTAITEVSTQVASAQPLSSPVHDTSTGRIFVVDQWSSSFVGGLLYAYTFSGTAWSLAATSGQLEDALVSNGSAPQPPIVDSTAARVYVFATNDSSGACAIVTSCMGVFQLQAGFSNGSTGTESQLGYYSNSLVLYPGDFTNAYYTSGTPTSPSGALIICGYTKSSARNAQLYSIAISSNVLGAVTAGATLTNSSASCSPVTEFFKGSDQFFLSVANSNSVSGTNCSTGGCVYSYPGGISTPVATIASTGGSSGIIIDNSSATIGASQVYYSTLSNQPCAGNGTSGTGAAGTGGCAVQASQATLH